MGNVPLSKVWRRMWTLKHAKAAWNWSYDLKNEKLLFKSKTLYHMNFQKNRFEHFLLTLTLPGAIGTVLGLRKLTSKYFSDVCIKKVTR